MKNQILLSALLLCGFTASANEAAVSVESSPVTISAKTMEIFNVYFELGTACSNYANGITNDRAALLKVCALASELLKDAIAFAKKAAKTDEVHEKIYEFEQNFLPKIKGAITFFKAVITSPDVSDDDLREMIQSHSEEIPQAIQGFLQG